MQRRSGQLETGSAGVQVAATLDLQSLRSRCEAGEEFKFLLFWGHTVPTGGQVGKTCLSQWYPSPFTVDGVLYHTAEHFMMAEKARIFGDDEKLAEILAAAKAPQVSTPWRHENPLKQSLGYKNLGYVFASLFYEQHVPAKQRCMYFQLQPSVHSSHLNKQKTESACSTLTRGVISEAPFRPQCAGTSCGRLMLGDAAPHNGTRSGGQGPHANLQRLVLAQGQYGS